MGNLSENTDLCLFEGVFKFICCHSCLFNIRFLELYYDILAEGYPDPRRSLLCIFRTQSKTEDAAFNFKKGNNGIISYCSQRKIK